MKIKEVLSKNLIDNGFLKTIGGLDTPCYIYNLNIIEDIIHKIRLSLKDIDNIKLHFAVKANRNIEILKFINDKVDGFDVATIYEAQILNNMGINNYTLNGPGFTSKDIKSIYEENKYLDFNSFSQLKSEISIIKNKIIGLRINIAYYENNKEECSRFGVDILEKKIIDFLKENEIKVKSLHFHGGEKNWKFFAHIRKILSNIDTSLLCNECYINLGGGIEKYVMKDTLEDLSYEIKEINSICKKRGIKNIFIIEPGSALVNLSGYMISKVISSDYIEKRNKFNIVIDSSAYNLHLWYKPKILTCIAKGQRNVNMDIYGITCYENDVFFKDINLKGLDIGDKIILYPVGAYSSSNHINLHNIPFPEEYFYYNKKLWK